MPSQASSISPVLRPPSSVLWLSLVAFALLWADLIRQLSHNWSVNEQYSYGYMVPFLCGYLAFRRWADRPPLAPPAGVSWWIVGPIALAALLYLPVRLVHEINPMWPSASWLLALSVVAFTWYALYRIGGSAWVRHFGFATAFILVAVRWFQTVELPLVHGLMQVVSALTVEVAGVLGIPVLQQGNVLHLTTGPVKVEEACSGIRSLQSSLMIALFFGEYYRLNLSRRTVLLIGGLAIAFVTNLARTLILVWHASNSGIEAIDKWHDTTGMSIVLVCFAGLWSLGAVLKKIESWKSQRGGPGTMGPWDHGTIGPSLNVERCALNVERSPSSPLSPSMNVERCALNVERSSDLRPPSSDLRLPPPALRPPFLLSSWLILAVFANEGWYRLNEWSNPILPPSWTVEAPADLLDPVRLTEEQIFADMLQFDHGFGLNWRGLTGQKWGAFFFRWDSGSISSRVRAREHRPDVCLPGGGWRLEASHGVELFAVGDLQLPFERFTFTSGGTPLHVFFCVWEDGTENIPTLTPAWSIGDWFDGVRRAQRRLGQQTFQVVVQGYPTFDAAERAFREVLPPWIVLSEKTVGRWDGGTVGRWDGGTVGRSDLPL